MNFLITLLIFGICFAAMAIGLIFAKKTLKKGCSVDPHSCACRAEGKNPLDCDK